jgi:hypothetical protein
VISKLFLAICSPKAVLGIPMTIISALELVGKYLKSLSNVPDAAVDCRDGSQKLELDNTDPVRYS